MEFLQVVEVRRAVREYESAPVEAALIERLINIAVLAPSAMNLQPWAFVVVTDPGRIEDYARRAKQHLLDAPHTLQLTTHALTLLKDPNLNILYHAPVLLLVLAKSDEAQTREDCCLAAQTLMLAARDAGLGTCWIGFARPWLNLPGTKAELGLAASDHVVAPIVMGYPKQWPQPHGRNAPQIKWLR